MEPGMWIGSRSQLVRSSALGGFTVNLREIGKGGGEAGLRAADGQRQVNIFLAFEQIEKTSPPPRIAHLHREMARTMRRAQPECFRPPYEQPRAQSRTLKHIEQAQLFCRRVGEHCCGGPPDAVAPPFLEILR